MEELRSAIREDPWYIEPHFNLAIAFIKTVRFDEAIPELKEVLRINSVLKKGHYGEEIYPRLELEAHANLGNIYSSKDMYEDAVLHYREGLKLAPGDTSTRFNLAVTYKRMGRLDEARAEFEEILRVDPTDRGARWNLKMLGRR
jgi:superkiller protein 3